MAIAFDASNTNVASSTGNLSWSHGGAASNVKGVVVQIAQDSSQSNDQVTTVTYGSLTLTRVSGATAFHTSGETGAVYTYVGTSGVPQGTQTVTVTVTASGGNKDARSYTLTGARDLAVEGSNNSVNGTGITNPSATITARAAVAAWACGLLLSGQNATSGLAAGAGTTEVEETDFGNQTASFTRITSVTGGGNITYGWTASSSDATIGAVALSEQTSLGTLTKTLDNATVSGTAAVTATTRTGTLTKTLDSATVEGTGTIPVSGNIFSAQGTISVLTSDTVGATKVISGLSFQPQVIFFSMTGCSAGTNTVESGTAFNSFGVAVSTSGRRCIGGIRKDAVSTNVERNFFREDAVVQKSTDAAADGLLDLTAVASDGFTCTVDQAFGANVRIQWMALGGDSITNTAVGTYVCPTTVTTLDVTDVGFRPNFVMLLTPRISSTTPPQPDGQDSSFSIGVWDGTRGGYIISGGNDAATTTLSASSGRMGSGGGAGTECNVTFGSTADAVNQRADISAFLSNGFTLNFFDSQSTAANEFYLAIKGGNIRVDELTTRTDGNNITLSGFGFKPSAALFLSAMGAEDATNTVRSDAMYSLGMAAGPSERGVHASYSQNGLSTSAVKRSVEYDQVYTHLDSTGVIATMDLVSFDSGGLTCVMDDTEPTTGSWVGVVAFGPALSGPQATLSKTLDSATVAGTGTIPVTASLTKTLANATVAGTATVPITSSLTKTLANATVAGTGTIPLPASLTKTLDSATVAGTANVTTGPAGSLTVTLGNATEAGTANVALSATLTKTLDSATVAGTAQVIVAGSLSKTLDGATVAGTASRSRMGTLSKTLDSATVAGTAQVSIRGTLSKTLANATVAGTGLVSVKGTLSKTLGNVTLAGTGTVPLVGSLTKTLGNATVAGTGLVFNPSATGSLAVTLQNCTLTGHAKVHFPSALVAGYGTYFYERSGGEGYGAYGDDA